MEQIETVKMTAEELKEFKAFQAEKERKALAERQAGERDAYKDLVDECVEKCFPSLKGIATQLAQVKTLCYETFTKAIELKADVYGVKDGQKSHTFTHRELGYRITLGNYETDNYDDTVNAGIEKVKQYLSSLAKDEESQMMVKAILKLVSRDMKGNLKAGRVLQLRQMANESGNAEFIDGVRIIEAAFQPAISKTFVKAEYKDEKGEWKNVPTGMTEA